MTDTRQSNIHESIATERERDEARAEVERLRGEMSRIDRLPVKWAAPLCHEVGDEGQQAWAAVGSEAHLIAHRALGGNVESARALTVPTNREGHHGHDDR